MIETERLVIRRHSIDDFEFYRAMMSDPSVYRTLGGDALSREVAWNRLLRYEGHWSWLGYGLFAVFDKSSGIYVGNTGIADFGRTDSIGLEKVDEAAWVFTTTSRGTGIAFEAARAVHEWYDKVIGRRTICLIAEDNKASTRLATRLGYVPYAVVTYRERALTAFARDGR